MEKTEWSGSMKTRGFEIVSNELREHLEEEIKLPQRNDEGSAGYDLRTPCKIIIPPHSHSNLIFTDICAYMQKDEVLKISLACSCTDSLPLKNPLYNERFTELPGLIVR